MIKRYLPILLLSMAANAQVSHIQDIFPGNTEADPAVKNSSNPNNFFVDQGQMLFRANNGVNGVELWKTDGTAAGTALLKDIATGATNSNPSAFVKYNGQIYFNATTGTSVTGQELYRTDGTEGGTVLVKDIRVGTGSSNPQNFIPMANGLLFSANDGTAGVELWKTDGTEAGTALLKDYPGTANSITWAEKVNDLAVFGQIVGTTGRELYISDGTEAGSSLLLDLNPGTGHGVGTVSFAIDTHVYFSGNDGTTGSELWRTDGTLAGTHLVKDINPGATASNPRRFAAIGTTVYFGANGVNGNELWKTDGTEAGTVEVTDINTSGNSNPDQLGSIGTALYFFASDDETNYDLYRLENDVVTKVYDFNAPASTVITNYVALDGKIYFAADSNADNSRELWATDGTTAGTQPIASLFPDSAAPIGVNNLTAFNGELVFSGDIGEGIELLVLNPQALDVPAIASVKPSVYPNPSKGLVHIAYPQDTFEVRAFDLNGRLVLTSSNAYQQASINLPSGFYILQIETPKGTHTKKIIIE